MRTVNPKKTAKTTKVVSPALKEEPKPRLKKKEVKKQEKALRILGLEALKVPAGAHKKRKYLGRGSSSGHGKTSTRGSKGQTSRAGRDFYTGFEGGQTPMIRRFPKRGFFNVTRKEYQIVNLSSLAKLKAQEITPQVLEDEGIIKDKDKPVKILGQGALTSGLTVKAHAFSKKANSLISKAGGKVEIIKEA